MLDAVAELRARWARGETTTNCWLMIPQPFVAEVASRAGFDSLCIDLQHGLVETAEEAARAVAACYYPPQGNRSYGPSRAAVVVPDYFQRAKDGLLIFVMIETRKALENLDGILDTPGLTGVYVGPADLSLSLGFPPEMDSGRPEHQTAIRRIIEACHQRGLVVGLHSYGPQFAAVAAGWGVDFVTIATDANTLRIELGRRVEEFAGLVEGAREA